MLKFSATWPPRLRSSPNRQCVDGIKDICLGQVEDDVSVKVPDFQNALFVAPEQKQYSDECM